MIETRRAIGETRTGEQRDTGQLQIFVGGQFVGIIFDSNPEIALCHEPLTQQQRLQIAAQLNLKQVKVAPPAPEPTRAQMGDLF